MVLDTLVEAAGREEEENPPHRVAHDALNSSSDGAVLARFDRPRASTPTRIGVFSDPHVATEAEGTWKVFHGNCERVRAVLADLRDRDVDGVVVSGDLTKDGESANLAWAGDALTGLDVPTLVVPGNHDLLDSTAARFADLFDAGDYPVHRRLGGLDVVGIDTGDGGVDDAQCERLDSLLADLADRRDGAGDAVVVSHHNLPGLREHVGAPWAPHPPVDSADALVEVLARHDVGLHLSGHVHLPGVTVTRGVRGLVSPALSSFPQAYLLLAVGPEGTTVRCLSASDGDDLSAAYRHATDDSKRARRIADLTAIQVADLPVVDEREQGCLDVRSIL